MKPSARKRVSFTKLSLARIKYIREHYLQFATHQLKNRRDMPSIESMHQDTVILEACVEVFFKAMCKVLELPPEEADKIAIAEYSSQRIVSDEFLDKLTSFVELEYNDRKIEAITPSERMKAVAEYKDRKREISDEWGEE